MPPTQDVLDRVTIASPCSVKWDDMTGDDRVRLCGQCALHVYNFEEMTSGEVRELVTRTEGRLCGRFYRRMDGTMVTSDCPVAFEKLKYRMGILAGSLASIATLVVGAILVLARGRSDVDFKNVRAVQKVCQWAGNGTPPYQQMAGGIVAMPQLAVAPTPVPVATPALVQIRKKAHR